MGRHQHPFDKKQTLFLVQLCLAVLGLDPVGKEQCTCVCDKIILVPLLSETTKREDGSLNLARMEKHSNRPSFWKFECHQTSSAMVEASSTQDQATVLFVLDTSSDVCEAVHHCLKQILAPDCLLVDDKELIVTLTIRSFCSTSGLHERAPIVLGVCEEKNLGQTCLANNLRFSLKANEHT